MSTSDAAVRSFEFVDDAVPRDDSFFRVDGHRRRDRALADAHEHVSYEELDESVGGEPLWAVTVGEGSWSALLFGAPHPNEPIGSMTIDFLLTNSPTTTISGRRWTASSSACRSLIPVAGHLPGTTTLGAPCSR